MKNNISQFDKCANCGACYNICPSDAIGIIKNEFFYKLSVDDAKCINCGKCVAVCPLNSFEPHLELRTAYCGWHLSQDIVLSSSSGGAFKAIARSILKDKGVVYGAAFSDDKKEVVFRSTNEITLDEIARSKYVESQPQQIFRRIKDDLETGSNVLFCGAPCQVAGLKRFLMKEYTNLLTCDFACGGMPSHQLFENYISELEEKYHARVNDVNFRPKLYGWSLHAINVAFDNGKNYKNIAKYDPYMYSFIYSRMSIRDNCITCPFRENHYSDIILADFWKWNTISTLKNNEKGISLIISNSEKGDTVLAVVKNDMYLVQIDIDDASYNCKAYQRPSNDYYSSRKLFFDTYEKNGLMKSAVNAGMKHGKWAEIRKVLTILRREMH